MTISLQPDLMLTLDNTGIIQNAQLSGDLAEQDAQNRSDQTIDRWVGKAWRDTCHASNTSKVERLIRGALQRDASGYSQINQIMPDGGKILFEFVVVKTGDASRPILAIGKNLNAVVSLQNKLLSAQQSMETEFWKLRELETRYSTLVNASPEVILVVRDPDFKVIDANEDALRALGATVNGKISDLIVDHDDETKLKNLLETARQSGRSPLILIKVGAKKAEWRVRASSYQSNSGIQFMLQFFPHSRMGGSANIEPINGISLSDIFQHLPEGLVAINSQNIIMHANPAFTALINRSSADGVLGKSINQWLQAPNNDLVQLRSRLAQNEVVSNFPSKLNAASANSLYTQPKDVFLSAKRVTNDNAELMLLLVRPVAA